MVPAFFRTDGVPSSFVMVNMSGNDSHLRKSAITAVTYVPNEPRPLRIQLACGTEFKGVCTAADVQAFLRVIATDDGPTMKPQVNPVEQPSPYFCGAACAHFMEIANHGLPVHQKFNNEALRRVSRAMSVDAALTALVCCEASFVDYLRDQIKAGEFSKKRYLNPVHILSQAHAVSFVCGAPDRDFIKFMQEVCMLAKEDTVIALLVQRGYHEMATKILDQHVDYFLTYA